MSRTLKYIDMTLDPKSIALAIKQVADVQKQLEECLSDLAEHLTQYGAEVARINVQSMDAIFTGDLLGNGIYGVYNRETHHGAVYTDKWYAVYVEFGTGYQGASSEAHPLAGEFGWEAGAKKPGESGWAYPAEWGRWIPKTGPHAGEKMAWTNGMPSRPFMYNTLRELEWYAEHEGSGFFQIR